MQSKKKIGNPMGIYYATPLAYGIPMTLKWISIS